MKYVKPDFEELELVLEGSFLNTASTTKPDPTDPDNPGIGTDPGDNEGEDWN